MRMEMKFFFAKWEQWAPEQRHQMLLALNSVDNAHKRIRELVITPIIDGPREMA